MSAVSTALQGLPQPLQSTSGLSGILDALGFNSVESFFALGNTAVPYTVTMNTVNLAIGATHIAQWPAVGAAGTAVEGEVGSGAGTLASADPTRLGGSVVTAGMAQGPVVGQLSVPPGWATAAPKIRTIARALPLSGATAAPSGSTGSSAGLCGEMALAGMAGRALGGTLGMGSAAVGAVNRQHVASSQPAAGGLITGMATELQKLAELHNSAVLTDDEFTELKARLLHR